MRSEDWDAKFAGSEALFGEGPSEFVVAELSGLAPGRALDLAAGQGRNAVWLAERGWRVTAVDFSPVGLGRAEDLAARHEVAVSFMLCDVCRWQPPAGAFDLVLVSYLHLPEAQLHPVLAGAAHAVASGGTMLVLGHDRENLTRGTGGPQEPDVLYTTETVSSALAGLRVENAGRVERLVRTEDGTRTAIDTMTRARRDSPAQGRSRSHAPAV